MKKILLDTTGDISWLKKAIDSLDRDESIKAIIVMSCDENMLDEQVFNQFLKQVKKPIFGGIFPGLIFENKKHSKGNIVIGSTRYLDHLLLENIHFDSHSYTSLIEKLNVGENLQKTILVFVDGLSSGVEAFKEEIFNNIGLKHNYIGGGSGSLTFERHASIISNKGLLLDSGVLAVLDVPSGVGVAHGWQAVSEAMKVTEVDRNKIISLNWKPAFSVYQEVVEKLSNRLFSEEDFFSISKGFPFGISKVGTEMVVRDPIGIDKQGCIVCVGEVPQNAFVHILKGESLSLIEGARTAKKRAEEAFEQTIIDEENGVTLFIDCISRVLFLEDDFQKELDIVSDERMIGALTLGEIANTGKTYLELYNKTSVIGILEGI